VAASILPLADFVRQVGGPEVEVELLVPPGASVHTYEPTPAQVEFLARARLLVINGVELEFWAGDVVDAAGNAELLVVDTSKGIKIIEEEEAHREGEKEHEYAGGNPHIWLNPLNAVIQMEHIRDALIHVDPEHKELYTQNAARFRSELKALDEEIRAEVSTWRGREFVAFHSAYIYFARRYGLKQVAVIEEFPGKEPNPQQLAHIIEETRELEAKAIFSEPQLPAKAAHTIAEEAGKTVVTLDPLGGGEGRATYLELMRHNLGQMAKALK